MATVVGFKGDCRRLIEMGICIGKDIEIIRIIGNLTQVRTSNVTLILDKELYDKIITIDEETDYVRKN